MKHSLRLLAAGLITSALFLTACKTDVVYSEFYSIPSDKWSIDSIAYFDYTISDTTMDYNMQIYIRHTERYPYQNLWLFVGDSSSRDSINVFMADDRGRWYGDSNNGFIEVAVPFGEHLHFVDTGMYHLAIQHGMRDSLLQGITEVGLEIRKSE